jgi:hypothetical protein
VSPALSVATIVSESWLLTKGLVSEIGQSSVRARPEFFHAEPSRQTNSGAGHEQGSAPQYVLQAIEGRPGSTALEVLFAVRERGHNISEQSILASLSRLRDSKLIVVRQGKWFPA